MKPAILGFICAAILFACNGRRDEKSAASVEQTQQTENLSKKDWDSIMA
jgi:hypothetical protein